MKSTQSKTLLVLAGRPVLWHTLTAFQQNQLVDEIILVVTPGKSAEFRAALDLSEFSKIKAIVDGGKIRDDSCRAGLAAVQAADFVAFHDGARPLISQEIITRCIQEASLHGAAVAAVPVKDTLKEVNPDGFVERTPDRSRFWAAQTPQVVRFSEIKRLYDESARQGISVTDDVTLIERAGGKVKIVMGEYRNLKLTTPEDMAIAGQFMGVTPTPPCLPPVRTGMGQDSHRFVPEGDPKALVMGGVIFPGTPGLEANSDGDVVLHAIFNALSQAVGGHSIGRYADPLCLEQGITDSARFMDIPLQMLDNAGYRIANIGVMIECRRPKIDPLSEQMCARIAEILHIEPSQVGVTATSGEGLTDFGRGEGVQAWVVATLMVK